MLKYTYISKIFLKIVLYQLLKIYYITIFHNLTCILLIIILSLISKKKKSLQFPITINTRFIYILKIKRKNCNSTQFCFTLHFGNYNNYIIISILYIN